MGTRLLSKLWRSVRTELVERPHARVWITALLIIMIIDAGPAFSRKRLRAKAQPAPEAMIDWTDVAVGLSDSTAELLPAPREVPLAAEFRVVGPDFFRQNRISFRSGRNFSEADRPGMPYVVIINETLSRALWPDRDAVGNYITVGFGDPVPRLIVGVVADSQAPSCETRMQPEIYVPCLQAPSEPLILVHAGSTHTTTAD
jgi:hypothetical protein